jgi:glutamate N-acetyltransferase/amino-acid N-acetyltransferase
MNPITLAAVRGFRFTGVWAGLRPNGEADMALLVSDAPCTAAGVFTRNLVRAAPVVYDQALLQGKGDGFFGVVINAKNANAVTGEPGLRDAEAMAQETETTLNLPPHSIFVMSTGVIGVPLPMEKIRQGITLAANALDATPDHAHRVAHAIMTTDTYPKQVGREVQIGGKTVTLAGIAKGAGMIHPDMATMLGVIITDAAIAPVALASALRYATDRSYNCISVDGDTSTNDTQLVLANGLAEHELIVDEDHSDYPAFRDALTALCIDLAKLIAFDGEGATKQVTIQVEGCRTFEEARQIGRTIATSPLVKTALYGRDANWGRVLAAAGRAGVTFDPTHANLWFGDLQLLNEGIPVGVDEARALEILSEREVLVTLRLGEGSASATIWTCDFSEGYVQVNAEYRT